jgi:hypothetical protein
MKNTMIRFGRKKLSQIWTNPFGQVVVLLIMMAFELIESQIKAFSYDTKRYGVFAHEYGKEVDACMNETSKR